MDREIFEQLKEQADKERKTFKSKETSGINMDGAFTMAPSRAQMRKVEDLQTKEFYVKKVLRAIEEQSGSTDGIIPHPLAWQINIVDETVYAFAIDGREVACAFTESGEDFCVHWLAVDGKTLIDTDSQITARKGKNQIYIVAAAVAGLILLFVLLSVIGNLLY